MAEVELFSASLAPFGLRPVFFSGCPVACAQAKAAIKGIHTYSIDKSIERTLFDIKSWREGLGVAAVDALNNDLTRPYTPKGPFKAVVTLREGDKTAVKIARRWGFEHQAARIFFEAPDIHRLYRDLIRLCYLTPFIERCLPFGLLACYNLLGRIGLNWVRRQIKGNPVIPWAPV
jgi:hypothetical protein